MAAWGWARRGVFAATAAAVLGVGAAWSGGQRGPALLLARGTRGQEEQRAEELNGRGGGVAGGNGAVAGTTGSGVGALVPPAWGGGAAPRMSGRERRFLEFASLEHLGQVYMTPSDFLDSVTYTLPDPEGRAERKVLCEQEVEELLSATPRIWKNSSRLFRSVQHDGLISYTEYVFLLTILTKPHAGFQIAFTMFDTDGNRRIDKKEFLVLEEIFRKKNEKKFEHEQDEDTALLYLQLYGYRHPLIHKMLVARGGIPGPERSYWQALRRGTNRLFFSRESEAMEDYVTVDTTLLIHFFGKKGNAELTYEDFHRFMDELQTEVLELEFVAYSGGLPTVSGGQFARALLRYARIHDPDSFLASAQRRLSPEQELSFEEFCSFFRFINNLEDFSIAVQMHTYSSRPLAQEEFERAVWISTAQRLSPRLVDTVFRIFDADGDGGLSHREFVGLMRDRQSRGFRSHTPPRGFSGFKSCVRKEMIRK